jgi:hypothetical protein
LKDDLRRRDGQSLHVIERLEGEGDLGLLAFPSREALRQRRHDGDAAPVIGRLQGSSVSQPDALAPRPGGRASGDAAVSCRRHAAARQAFCSITTHAPEADRWLRKPA